MLSFLSGQFYFAFICPICETSGEHIGFSLCVCSFVQVMVLKLNKWIPHLR